MGNIHNSLQDVKEQVAVRLHRLADRAQKKGDMARARRFKEGADFLEHGDKPTWARRLSERGR